MTISLNHAQRVGEELRAQFAPLCSRFEIAGSVRRRRPQVNDLDIVLIPRPDKAWDYHALLLKLGPVKMSGPKITRVQYGDIPVDIYVATPETWVTLLLIRTGSAAHNVKLCSIAKNKNMVLHADGRGLYRLEVSGCEGREVAIPCDSEAAIFQTLGLAYKQPWERER